MPRNKITMRDNYSVALPGNYFGWNGGIDFLRHIANRLLAKQQTVNLKIFLLLPLKNLIETPIDLLRVAKRSIVNLWHRKRPWFARPCAEYHESFLEIFEHIFSEKIEIVYHQNTVAGLLRCLRTPRANR